MRILFVKLKEIGDCLILTPTLRATRQAYPKAEIWVVVRRGCEGILAGCPEIDRILTVTGVEKSERTRKNVWQDLGVLWQLRSVYFDVVLELSDGHRGRLLALLTRAKRRYTVKLNSPMNWCEKRRMTAESSFYWLDRHRVEKDFYTAAEFLDLPGLIPPMVFERDQAQSWSREGEVGDFCFMQIGSRKPVNRWPRERWRQVAVHLLTRFQQIVVSGGRAPDEVADAEWLRSELGPRMICTLGETTWAQVAGLLYRTRLYVGLNTAAMHLAAACGCPIVALFGRTSEEHWQPWQANYRIVAGATFSHVADPNERHRLARGRQMEHIQPQQVIEACEEMMATKR